MQLELRIRRSGSVGFDIALLMVSLTLRGLDAAGRRNVHSAKK